MIANFFIIMANRRQAVSSLVALLDDSDSILYDDSNNILYGG